MSINVNTKINTLVHYPEKNKDTTLALKQDTMSKKTKPNKVLKPTVFLSATAGILVALGFIAKGQGINLLKNNKMPDFLKPKTWKLAQLEYNDPMDIIKIAAGSTAGGLTAGIALDPQNKKAKLRESLQQMVGNIIIPVFCVYHTVKFFKKHEDKIKLPQLKETSGFSKNFNKFTKKAPGVFAALGALAISIKVGNWVANKISQKVFNVHDQRKIEIGDFSGHLDDICLATMLISPDNKFGQIAGKIIPVALLVAGYESGVKKNKE